MRRRPTRSQPVGPASDGAVAHVESILGHVFSDRELLRTALTHPVAVEGMDPLLSYQRLEFLGDSIVSMIVADELYRRFPDWMEGELTRVKVAVVRGATFTRVARELGFSAVLEGLNLSARGRDSALENIFEASVGALYLDAGYERARQFVLGVLGDLLTPDACIPVHPKTRFLESMAADGRKVVFEVVSEEGPSHDRVFTVEVRVDGAVVGSGTGSSKKEAETAAAANALGAGVATPPEGRF